MTERTKPAATEALLHWLNRNGLAIVAVTAFLVVSFMAQQQAYVIESQRTLIRTLADDSSQLLAYKLRAVKEAKVHRTATTPQH